MTKVYGIRALANTLVNMLPTLSILFIIVTEVLILGNSFSVTKIFSIVSIITLISGPLADFVAIMDAYNEYKYAISSLGKFFFSIENSPNKKRSHIMEGVVEFKNCRFEKVDEVSMFQGIQIMFGEHLKMLGKPQLMHNLSKERVEH